MLQKCFKCGSLVEKFPCVHCKELVVCNSCGLKFKGTNDDLNCPSCIKKINYWERNTDGVFIREVKFFHKDWSKHGVEIFEKPDKQKIKIDKKGNKKEITSFRLK